MPVWVLPLITKAGQFIGQRFVHFLVYLFLAAITIGIPYVLFVRRTVSNTDKIYDGGYKAEFKVYTLPLSCAHFDPSAKAKK